MPSVRHPSEPIAVHRCRSRARLHVDIAFPWAAFLEARKGNRMIGPEGRPLPSNRDIRFRAWHDLRHNRAMVLPAFQGDLQQPMGGRALDAAVHVVERRAVGRPIGIIRSGLMSLPPQKAISPSTPFTISIF